MGRPLVIGISGGIGSGKSVVSRILRIYGYPVFDCDSEARVIMDVDDEIKQRISDEISAEAVARGVIDRACLAGIVFADEAKLAILNSIVHGAVRRRFARWVAESDCDKVFVEAAILHSSGMIADVDAEWHVTAPVDVRVTRVMSRNGMTDSEVRARIASQQADDMPPFRPVPVTYIVNDGVSAILPQIRAALADTK